MKSKDWRDYQHRTFNEEAHPLLKEFVKKYKVKDAIDLGCGAGNESVYLIKHGINVCAIDRQLNENYINDRLDENEKNKVKFVQASFSDVKLEKSDLVIAFFSLPFCGSQIFNEFWEKIYDSINYDGYFVGQLFGERDAWNKNPNVNTFSRMEIDNYLKKYNVLKLEEVEYIRKSDNKKWHYYNIIAQKRK